MIIYLVILFISFLLDGVMSNYFVVLPTHISFFNTIYTIIALVIISSYFSNIKRYLLLASLFGLLFDITYTNTLFLNVIVFLIIGLNVIWFNSKLPSNILNNTIISVISVSFYYILTYSILLTVNYFNINITLLFHILSCSIIMTIIYSVILSFTIFKLDKKHEFKIIK